MSNTLNRLGSVLDKTQRTIATIVTVNPNGTTLVEYSDSSQSVVLGDSVQEGAVYVENGRVVGSAPTLPFTEIEV
ncbi:conserved hypothetical protein [Pseudoalteromonas sp. 3J6]|jgi:hypothetical protein|uniref:hypothetical protein n=1 Tax=Pseudoalteromonas sp. 3J6 TaxID=649161 RepID=UPI00175E1641|nr:hypothetical protein [Pseudoalteromonas sp. 3J6]CAD2224997.1 conserved hypothetical protein [Pseudoalteromonas sp. 3J6]